MIVGSVAALAAATVALACVALYGARSGSVAMLSKTHTLAATYQSDVASRQDLNSYFDNENKVAKKAHRKDFTSEAAKQQLSAIFGNSKADHMSATVKHIQKKLVTQDLAYSAKDANSDLDSYFDSMQETNVRANRAHARKETSVDDDGLPVLTSQKSKQQQEDAAVNKEELENYKKNNPDFKKRMDTVHLKWMEQHGGGLPKSKAEIKAYAALVEKYVGDISELVKKARTSSAKQLKEDPNMRKQALEKYLRENPDVKHKMAQAKKQFFDKYGHAPQSDKQNQEYHDLMKKYVGHIDINVKKILGKGAVKTQKKYMVEDKFTKAQRKIDKIQKHMHHQAEKYVDKHGSGWTEAKFRAASENKKHPFVSSKAKKVADQMDKEASTNNLDAEAIRMVAKQTHEDEAPAADAKHEEDETSADAVKPKKAPRQQKHASKDAPVVTEEIPVMPEDTDGASVAQLKKMRELKKYEAKHKKFSRQLNEVHMEWAKTHHGPPHTDAEQKEYATLLKKMINHGPNLKHTKKINQFHAPDLNDQFKVAAGKGINSLAAEEKVEEHSEAEEKIAKVRALQDLEAHDPKIKTKIAEVHHQWMKAGHKAPPSTPAEEKEYQKLMEKIVGHPDISFQTN